MSAATLEPRCHCGRILIDGRCVEHSGETYCQPCDRWITSHQYRRHVNSTAHIIKVRGPITGGAVDDGATPRLPAEYMELAEKAAEWKAQRDALLAAAQKVVASAYPANSGYNADREVSGEAIEELRTAIALAEGGA